ncbi:cytochrome c oxidase subunit 2 [Jatrophihabitans endophyticus]|uniref:Cytochrome c oxidase subunit 2 n=1 Tax=Jatrophihabitans endophyticus TaxID=1206085 RepID=A0A1M5L1V7_9ACTN|nr:cytochrome c oxidase subunit II [Jatrophihabitans endophyticus]SHG58910.1 cytochrome c oxidase subunit 2 [Jatrophihabitans endophyticus]
MRRSRWVRGGRLGLLVAALAVLLTGCSAKDWERNLRFGFPTGVTKQAERIRVLWTWSGVAALALGCVVWGLIFWCCIRYRKRNDELPRQTKYNFLVEAICFTFPFIVIAVLFYRTVVVEDYANKLTKNPDVKVQADAFKWNWEFEYQTYRGVEANKAEKAQVLRYTKPDGSAMPNPEHAAVPYYLQTVGDSNTIPILVLPVNQTVQVTEHSFDVLHSFWVPEFLFKRDVVPYEKPNTLEGQDEYDTSRDNKFEFTATKTGSYVGRCAELCGTYHSQMNFEVRVVPQQTFVTYLEALRRVGPDDPNRQAKALQIAMPNASPIATTTYPLDTDRTAQGPSQRGGN